MSIYTPFELVHAHLADVEATQGIVDEVAAPSERSFPPTEDVYSAPLHPDHAVSAALDPKSGTLVRAIYNGYALELRSLSAVIGGQDTNFQPRVLRIILPDPLRPLGESCVMSDLGSGHLVVIVVTQANVIYRFTFPLGAVTGPAERIAFTTKDRDWCEEVELDDETVANSGGVASWAVANRNTVILGCADGGIIKAERAVNSTPENPIWTTSQHRGHSRLRLGFFSRSVDETITSIADFSFERQMPVVYTFSRDSKLRTWSSASGNCLKTMDVRINSQELTLSTSSQPSSSSSQEFTSSFIRVIAHPNPSSRYSHIVVVFVPSPYDPSVPGTFVFYRASNTATTANDLVYAGERAGSPASAGCELRGFEIKPPTRRDATDGWRLWAVWDAKGKLAADSVPVNDILQFQTYHEPPTRPRMVLDWQRATCYEGVEQYDTSYFDNLLSLEAPDPAEPYSNDDISETFIQHLLYPGRFSTLDLTTALDDYISQLPFTNQERLRNTVHPTLASKFMAAVGCALTMKISPQTGAPVVSEFRADLKQQWLGVWARVCELDKQGRWPVSTASCDGQLVVLDREGASVPVQEDVSGVLVHLSHTPYVADEFQALHEGALVGIYPALAPPKARRALTAAAIAGGSMASALSRSAATGDEGGSALDAVVNYLNSELAAPPHAPPEDIAGTLWDDVVEAALPQETRDIVIRALAESSSVTRTLSDALDILATYPAAPTGLPVVSSWTFSGFGTALVTSTVSAIIVTRFAMARDVLLVALFHMATTPDLSEDDETSEDLIEVLARALVTYHRYRVLRWLSERSGAEATERSRSRRQVKRARGKDDVLAEFDGLKMRESDDSFTDPDGYDTVYSLLHSLLARQLPQQVPRDTYACLFETACVFLADLGVLSQDQLDVEPRSADVKLAYTILADGHANVAGEFTELYPLSSGTAFVRGLALIEVGDVDNGTVLLERASNGCRDGSLTVVLPRCSGKKGLGAYFVHVMNVVDQRSLWAAVALFGERALEAMDADDDQAKDIWTRVFLAYLQLEQYEEAYSTLTTAPFQEIKPDLLGQLISGICEAGEIGRLNSLGFIGFQKEVEECLNYKARNSDPLRAPNYYDVLYSWHISRGDYRSAAETMYSQAHRLGEVSTTKHNRVEMAAFRAQSYLSAINTLSLVDKRNRWISIQVPPGSARAAPAAKRRRVSKYIPESAFSAGVQAVDIVTLADVRAEYRTVLCQLQLCREIPDLLAGSVTLAPEEIVGFFVQRDKYDEAQLAASELDVDMTDLFVALATRCVELARAPHLGLDSPAAAFLKSPVTARLRGPPAALALRYLQVALERHDSAATQWRYTAAVADTLFALNEDAARGWSMPAWLVANELARDPQGWVARAVRYGWIREAVDWAADALRAETPADLLPRNKDAAVDTPYNLLDRVLAACTDDTDKLDADDTLLQGDAKALRQHVERRIAQTRKVAGV